jgi:SAM-dependent methyltransferase
MYPIKEKYPSISSSIAQRIEALLSYSPGHYLLELADKWLSTTQLDTIPHHLWLTEKRISHTKPHIYSHYEALPFSSESIDVILTPYLAHYERNLQEIIHESFRILKPNGYLFILGVYIPAQSKADASEARMASFRRLSRIFEISRQIKQAGGMIIERKYYFDYPMSFDSKKSLFFQRWQSCITRLLPSEHYYYLMIAQKNPRPIQIIPLAEPTMPFLAIQKTIYAKS